MINQLLVYDTETDSPDPHTCEPVQLAACILHPVSFEPIESAYFCTDMRPSDIDDPDYYDKHLDTITWHAKNYKISPEQVFERWKKAPDQKTAWANFVSYVAKYNKNPSRPSRFGAPVRAGMNIIKFDDHIINRMCKKYGNVTKGEQNIFHPRDVVDLLHLAMFWLESLPEPENYNMDELRRFFGMSNHGAHDALNDVKDEAIMIGKFMRLHRQLARRIQFKDSAIKEPE